MLNHRVQADAGALPFRTQSIRVGLCVDLLEHVVDPRATLREMARAATFVVFKVPLERSVYTIVRGGNRRLARLRERYGHLHHFRRNELCALVREGFELCDERFMAIPCRRWPTMWFQRLLLRAPNLFARAFGGFWVALARSRQRSTARE